MRMKRCDEPGVDPRETTVSPPPAPVAFLRERRPLESRDLDRLARLPPVDLDLAVLLVRVDLALLLVLVDFELLFVLALLEDFLLELDLCDFRDLTDRAVERGEVTSPWVSRGMSNSNTGASSEDFLLEDFFFLLEVS